MPDVPQIDFLINNAGTILRKPTASDYTGGAIAPVDSGWMGR